MTDLMVYWPRDPYELAAAYNASVTADLDAILFERDEAKAIEEAEAYQRTREYWQRKQDGVIARLVRARRTPHPTKHDDPWDLSDTCYACGWPASHTIHTQEGIT